MKQTSIRLTQETTDKINALARVWGLPEKRNRAAVIRRAINETYQREIEK